MWRCRRSCPVMATLLLSVLAACAPGEPPPDQPAEGAETTMGEEAGVVDVVARGLTLEAPAEIPSGWTTFRFDNQSEMIHFVVVERLPDGIGGQEQQDVVAPIFQEGMELLDEGNPDAAMARFGELPEWFGEIVFLGGPGLTSAGRASQATVRLEPGTYLLECYVKTNGIFHSYNPDPEVWGMVHELTVTDEVSEASEPEPTLELTVSAEEGYTLEGTPSADTWETVAVHFLDQTVHENFVGHDVQLVRLAQDTEMDALVDWMDWTRTGGLESPAPAEFLGGLEEMPAGETGYFSFRAEAGRYAFIAEVPDAQEKGLVHVFEVGAVGGG